MEHSPNTRARQQTVRLLEGGIRFFLAGALTASQIAGGYGPFALGLVAAAGPGLPGGFALAGTGVGALLFMDFADALPHLAAAILILTAATSFQGSAVLSRPKALPLTAAILTLTVNGIYVVQSLSPADQVTACLAAAGLTGISAWFFRPLFRPGEGGLADGILFLAASLLLAFSDLTLLGLSLGRAALCTLLAYAAYERGPAAGAAAGLGLGLTADLCAGTAVFTAGYGLAGLLTGSRRDRRRTGAAMAFLAASLVSLLPLTEPFRQPLLLEAAMGMAGFLALPGRLFGGKRIKRAAETVSVAGNPLKERLMKAAGALRELYDNMGRGASPAAEENPAVVFDRAAEKVCRECGLCTLCWQKEYTGTFNALNDATPYLLERGRALAKDFPSYFSSRCVHLPDFLTAVNGELSAFLLRRQYRRQLEETRRSARGQYAQLSELLTATAAGMGEAVPVSAVLTEEDTCRVGATLRPKEGETICGDTLMSFRREDGLWCLLLADGMGSGEPARKESALTCRLLRQFLEAGIEPEAALKTLNAAMALRGAETGSFTTIDLCTFHPAAGEASFYKYGAAPSYLKKGGAVRRIAGGSLPAGLRGTPASPDVTRVRLEPGSFAVMISDGVADPHQDEWVLDLLAGWEGEDPQALAGVLLAESIRREQLQDDCGIQVFYRPEVEKNGGRRV